MNLNFSWNFLLYLTARFPHSKANALFWVCTCNKYNVKDDLVTSTVDCTQQFRHQKRGGCTAEPFWASWLATSMDSSSPFPKSPPHPIPMKRKSWPSTLCHKVLRLQKKTREEKKSYAIIRCAEMLDRCIQCRLPPAQFYCHFCSTTFAKFFRPWGCSVSFGRDFMQAPPRGTSCQKI